MPIRDLLILGIIFGSLPFILYRPWFGILIWYWVSLMNPHRLTWGFAMNFPVAQVVAVAALLGLLLAKDRKSLPFTRETVLLALFAIHVTVAAWFALAPDAWEYWDRVIKILLITAVTPLLIYGRNRIMWLVLVTVLSLGFYGLKGGLFSILTGGNYRVWGPLQSFIGSNNALGMALIMTLPLMLVVARASWERRVGIPLIERFPRIFGAGLYSMFGLSVVATIFTQSRGALVGLLATTPLIVLKMRYRVPIILAGVLLSGVIVAAFPAHLLDRWETILHYQQDASAMQRLQAWGVNWNMAVERPLVGAGFFNYMIGDARWLSYANWVEPWANSPRAAHSIFFQVLGNQGFLGAALYFALILFTVHTLFRVRARARATSELSWAEDIAWALLVGIVGFFAAGAFLDMAYFHLIFLYIALAIILRREVEEARVLNVSAPVIEPTRHGRNVPKIAFPDFVARRD